MKLSSQLQINKAPRHGVDTTMHAVCILYPFINYTVVVCLSCVATDASFFLSYVGAARSHSSQRSTSCCDSNFSEQTAVEQSLATVKRNACV